MDTTEYIVTLDIGTTKICAIIGSRNEHGKMEVLGMGKSESLGVMRGVVSNIDKTVEAITKALDTAKDRSGKEINDVYVGIAGQHIKSYRHRGILTRNNVEEEINRKDIDQLIDDMHKLALPAGEKIIHVLPQEYMVDNEQGIKDPVGMSGIRLEANFHIITGQITAIQNIKKCVEKAGLKINDIILEPLASAAATLSEEEMEAGVALIDIGGGTTDIAIFQDKIIRHTAVIPFGGNVITDDIKEGCKVMKNQAEQLKIKFGSALADETQENEIVAIPGLRGREPKEISIRNLAHIIQARMEEIIDHIYYEIKSSGFDKKLIAGAVLTGGGSQLKHLVQLAEYVLGMDVRIGYPTEHLAKGAIDEVKHPMYATGIGLLIHGYEEEHKRTRKRQPEEEVQKGEKKGKWFENIIEKGRKWFEEDMDSDFE